MTPETQCILQQLMERHHALRDCEEQILIAAQTMIDCYQKEGKILACGNGGSAADCEHLVGELMKGFLLSRPLASGLAQRIRDKLPEQADSFISALQMPLPAISLVSQTGLNSAFINDVSPVMNYAQQVLGYGAPGDILLAFSTSGNSLNVVNAARLAQVLELNVIGITGATGGLLAEYADILIRIPSIGTWHIQEYTLGIYHALCAMTEKEMFAI